MPDNDGMIRDITISTKGTGDTSTTSLPPASSAWPSSAVTPTWPSTSTAMPAERAAEPAVTIEVPARSLLLALTAAIQDDQRTANGDSTRG